MKLTTLVTGTGRCGTLRMAELLTEGGLPCSHEKVFTPAGFCEPQVEAESSGLAAPWLGLFCGVVVHVVRNPIHTIESFLRRGAFSNTRTPHRRYSALFVERIGNPLVDAIRYYLEWNRKIDPYASIRIRIEDQPSEELGKFLGLSAVPSLGSTSVREARTTVDYRGVPSSLLEELCGIGKLYGYESMERLIWK